MDINKAGKTMMVVGAVVMVAAPIVLISAQEIHGRISNSKTVAKTKSFFAGVAETHKKIAAN